MISSYRKLLIHVSLFVFVFVSVQGCYTGCATCTGSGSNQCSTCDSDYYYVSSNHSCVACDPSCATCNGTADNCVTCTTGYYFLASNNSCVTCNAKGYSTLLSYCFLCDSSCKTCFQGMDSCLSCYPGSYLSIVWSEWLSSTDQTYELGQCLSCNATCQTCSGSLATNCLTCPSGAYLLISNNSCVACNVNGYYRSGSDCLQCNSSCLTCNGSLATNCLTCPSGAYLLISNNSCVACNVNGYYRSGSDCLQCNSSCLTCNGSLATNCLTCPSGAYFVSGNNSCVACNVNGYYRSCSDCLQCNSSCLTCNGSLATNCLTCPSGAYLLISNNSCVACNVNGYYRSGSDCLQCNSSCLTCSGSLATNCLTCPSGAYFVSGNNSCVTCNVNGYYISGSDCLQCNSSCLTCNGPASTNCLSCQNSSDYIPSNQTCAASNGTSNTASDAATVQAAETVSATCKVVFISATASAAIMYLYSKGDSPTLMRLLQIMARITFMKLIDVNYLTPLAKFYNYTDLGQFGLPNIFNKMKDTTTTSNPRVLAELNSSDGDSSSNFFILDVQGDATFNRYFDYSFAQIFLDDYGGIVFSSCITLVLYLIVRIVSKCFKNENSKIKPLLTKLARTFERSIIMTLLVSRYMYLGSSLIFNYVFHPLNGVYEQVSFGFAIFYTILLICIIGLTLCTAFYYTRESKAKLKFVRPLLNIPRVILHEYNRKRFIGRIFPFWTLLSDSIRVLILLLLYNWPVVQLMILIILSLITIILSLPNSVFKKTASKIFTIGTEVGFIIISKLFLVIYYLQNIGTSSVNNTLLIISWSGVGVNISIILFQLIIDIVEFFRLRREKRRQEREKKRQEQQQKAIQDLNELENPSRKIEQKANIDDSHNSQLIQMPDVDEMERAAEKYDGITVNRNESRTREAVSIGDANTSQRIQLQNSPQRELSFGQTNKYEGNILKIIRNRKSNRPPGPSRNKGDYF